MELVERDFGIFRECERWKFCLSRHIKALAGFSGQRACDRRLRVLIDTGYIQREKIMYGVPGIYKLTHKAKALIGASKRHDKIRVDYTGHDIAVLDTAIYFHKTMGIAFDGITTEKQLHSRDGFSVRKHQPDFTFTHDGKLYCVEVELTMKSLDRLNRNLKANFIAYDVQIWAVSYTNTKLLQILQNKKTQYSNIKILDIRKVRNLCLIK